MNQSDRNGQVQVRDMSQKSQDSRRQDLQQNTQQVLNSILNSIGSAVVVTDADGHFLTFNPAAEKMFGLDATMSAQETWSRNFGLYEVDGNTPLRESEFPLRRAMRGESADSVRLCIKNESMSFCLWVSVNIRPLLDESGRVSGGVVVFDDITSQIRLEQELRRSNSDLQQFAAVAAHDLQEPLRTIGSFLELFVQRNRAATDDKSVRYMNFIHDAVKRMQTLIDDLLTYSRVQSRAKPFEAVDCNEIVAEALADLKTSIKNSGATIDVSPLPSICADREQLKQVFQNLIGNALKFKREGVPLRVKIAATAESGSYRFSVCDNGIGIKDEYSERIFGIFQRLHSRETYPGSGIGLSICKRVVERHNGVISLHSVPGEGSTFSFTIVT